MPLVIYTARLGEHGVPDALDVSRKGGHPLGVKFAPSWNILRPILRLRKLGGESPGEWAEYVDAYTREMRNSYRTDRATFDELLTRERVVLQCYCPNPYRCHRMTLALILVKLDAEYRGEWSQTKDERFF